MRSSKTKQQNRILKYHQFIFILSVFVVIYIAYQMDVFNPIIIFMWNLAKPITFSAPTYDEINLKKHSYIRALNKAISEVSFEERVYKKLNTAGCFEFLTSSCEMNAVLFFF